jgi:glycosyltransferase involved in cell wall biosynthesis
MRILFVCAGGVVAGKERQTLEFMIGLRQLGHEVHCAVSSWSTGEFEKLLNENNITFTRLRIGFISLSFGWAAISMTLHQFLYVPSLFLSYIKLIKHWKPCVVVHSNFHHIFLLLQLMRSPNQVFHVHDVFGDRKLFRSLFRYFNTRIDLFIGVSEFVCNNLRRLNVPENKIALVYNSVRTAGAIPALGNAIPVVAIVGQIGSWKGHETLLKALAELKEQRWILYVVGFGDERYIETLKSLARGYGIEERVVFKGKLEGLENIYNGVDIVCVPSTISESFGLSAAEPGFFGIPVIASDLGGLPEVVIDNSTGIIVPAGDARKLADAISYMLRFPDKRRQFGAAARQHVNRLFSLQNNSVRMELLLRKLCNK